MRFYPSSATCCDADTRKETVVLRVLRNGKWKRAKMIFHYRQRDNAYFWHWSDQEVEKI